MRFTYRRLAAASLLFVSLLSSCGKKKEEAPPAPTPQPAAPTAKAETPVAPVSTPSAPQNKESPPAPVAPPAPAAATVEQTFSGTIGGQPVMMQLGVNESGTGSATVSGSYFLESQGTSSKIPLSGKLQDGNLVLEQMVQGAVTGTFDLLQDSANKRVYLGSWKGLGRVLPVKLTTVQ